MKITPTQYRAIGNRKKISKKNLERLENGLDPIKLEDQEAEELATYIRMRTKDRFSDLPFDMSDPPGIIHSTHVGNESGQSGTINIVAMMKKKKRLGVNKGFPDYILLARCRDGHAKPFAIELKRTEGSRTTPEQKQWIKCLRVCGISASVAKGKVEAVQIIESFIGKV